MNAKNLMAIAAIIITATATNTAAETDWNIEYIGNGNTVRIRSGTYNSDGEILRIPNRILETPVTSIGERAFQHRISAIGPKYTGVIIPESITEIGNRAFYDHNITQITIPKNVTTIGVEAFALNNQLTRITIGANVRLGRQSSGTNEEYEYSQDYAAFPDDFDRIYNQEGKIAGTYIKQNGIWTRTGKQRTENERQKTENRNKTTTTRPPPPVIR